MKWSVIPLKVYSLNTANAQLFNGMAGYIMKRSIQRSDHEIEMVLENLFRK